MICTCSMVGTIACRTCPTKQWADEGRVPSKVFFTYGVDAVEVVRCEDCTHAKEMTQYGCDEYVYYCKKLKIVTSPNWFCAEGNRDTQSNPPHIDIDLCEHESEDGIDDW